jgi:hypothetical protein
MAKTKRDRKIRTVAGQTVEEVGVDELTPYERNARKHSEKAVRQAASMIERFGFRIPILVAKGEIVGDGHLRLKAAKLLGMAAVPVLRVEDLSEDELRQFRISVNRMAELAEWDEDKLFAELEQVDAALLGEDGPIGFSIEDVDEPVKVGSWKMATVRDSFVVTLTGSLPLEAEVRERLRGLDVQIECSVIEVEE